MLTIGVSCMRKDFYNLCWLDDGNRILKEYKVYLLDKR